MTDEMDIKDLAIIRKVCREIGCSEVDPKLCKEHPERCQLVLKFLKQLRDHINESKTL